MSDKKKLVYGVGINDADSGVCRYETVDGKRKQVWICHFYDVWKGMLKRCYSEKEQSRYPTYKGCYVCDEWLTFSNFKSWMEQQDWEGKHLDKDLLVKGNKIYSPETCIFVTALVNTFTTDSNAKRGDFMIGVNFHKRDEIFEANCNNPFTNKKQYLGRFKTELEAHLAWRAKKHEHACQLAESELVSDPRLTEALKTRYI